MNLSKLPDYGLKKGFTLETNLSEVGGVEFIELMDSLNKFSPIKIERRIIERIMYQHKSAFTMSEIIEIMSHNDPVTKAFTILGIRYRNCNIKWLITVLHELQEFEPLKNIVATGPPSIKLKSERIITSGGTIIFEITTISVVKVQWRKIYNGQENIFLDHLRVKEFTTEQISYTTKEFDTGFFYIEVIYKGQFRKFSQYISVVNDKQPIEITPPKPCPESDGIKRLALLIGNMNYKYSVKLKAPETDICDLERVLLELGFTVYCFIDLNTEQMKSVLTQFSNLYEEDNTNIFFYFAGHGTRKEMRDHLELIDNKMPILDVLDCLMRKKPKMVVSMFDMCRDNNNENVNSCDIIEAKIPFHENLILLMSTLPARKAYETNECESNSLIIKPLCNSLSKYGAKLSISNVIANFITSCENINQKPTQSGTGLKAILGIDILIPRINPILEWSKIPEDLEIMKSIKIDSNIFHNFINIYFDETIIKSLICISNKNLIEAGQRGNAKINLFKSKRNLNKNDGSIDIEIEIKESSFPSKYPIKIFIPKDIILFL